jgi:hypothetical protein
VDLLLGAKFVYVDWLALAGWHTVLK